MSANQQSLQAKSTKTNSKSTNTLGQMKSKSLTKLKFMVNKEEMMKEFLLYELNSRSICKNIKRPTLNSSMSNMSKAKNTVVNIKSGKTKFSTNERISKKDNDIMKESNSSFYRNNKTNKKASQLNIYDLLQNKKKLKTDTKTRGVVNISIDEKVVTESDLSSKKLIKTEKINNERYRSHLKEKIEFLKIQIDMDNREKEKITHIVQDYDKSDNLDYLGKLESEISKYKKMKETFLLTCSQLNEEIMGLKIEIEKYTPNTTNYSSDSTTPNMHNNFSPKEFMYQRPKNYKK